MQCQSSVINANLNDQNEDQANEDENKSLIKKNLERFLNNKEVV